MKPVQTMDGGVAATITVSMERDRYLHRLRALAAWWSLGSSGLEPHFLVRYAPDTLSRLREAGL